MARLGWRPARSDMDDMLRDAWAWARGRGYAG
jgi:UDP-glucose 4-epimerase